MTATNEAALKLAREIAASLRPYSHNSALILDGERDGIDIVKVALAAIEKTTELAREVAKQVIIDARTGKIDTDLRSIGHVLDGRMAALPALKGTTDE